MTANEAHNISFYTFGPGDVLLVDANVWLYI